MAAIKPTDKVTERKAIYVVGEEVKIAAINERYCPKNWKVQALVAD